MDEMQLQIGWCASDRVFTRGVAVGFEQIELSIVDGQYSARLEVSTECVSHVVDLDSAEMVIRLGNTQSRLRVVHFEMDR